MSVTVELSELDADLWDAFMRGGPWIAHSEYMKLKADNAKLRELCADLRFCRRNNCLTCSHGRFCDMRFDERYAELGVEADE